MDFIQTLVIRRPITDDLESLHAMIVESTCGKTKITKSNLRKDLFGPVQNEENRSVITDPLIHLDTSLIETNRPTCQAFVAEVNGNPVGFVIFHYCYSPWRRHGFFIDNIYTKLEFRRRGIAKNLLLKVNDLSKSEGLAPMLFNSYGVDSQLMETLQKYKLETIRDNRTDWSVFRIKFR